MDKSTEGAGTGGQLSTARAQGDRARRRDGHAQQPCHTDRRAATVRARAGGCVLKRALGRALLPVPGAEG